MIERHLKKYPDKWNLNGHGGGVHLDFKVEKKIRLGSVKDGRQVSRFESVSIIVASFIALAWLGEVQRHPFLIFGPAAYFLKLSPIWAQVYVPIVGLTFLGMLQSGVNLVRPDWTRFRTVAQIILQAASVFVLYFVLRAGPWVTLADSSGSTTAGHSRAVEIVNQCIFYWLLIAAAISVVQVGAKIARLLRERRNLGAAPAVER